MVVTSSRRAARVNNKTKLLIYRGSDKVDLGSAEVIVWDHEQGASSEGPKHQHVGAKGVESGELLEHHLQAALSSASLLHSRTSARPSSPTNHHRQTSKPEAPHAALNYHIPTPDATGLINGESYTQLYQTRRYHEPNGYIRFSDTVEESSGGWGGLGYCMDEEDEQWLASFNSKGEGSSGEGGLAQSPLRESHGPNGMTPTGGRPQRNKEKGKEKEKEIPAPLSISEDSFEYIMGVFEKYTEDNVPMLYTDLALLPQFSSIEPLFASSIPASFLPSNEVPRGLPAFKLLTRMARSVFPYWKERRERRKGRMVSPMLNFDETNDNDPYVCFRRRDIRATRKTRRTDNYSVERMQKIQTELRSAHVLAQMMLQRESMKKVLYKADREVWEAKWKLYETKRRWPSLGMTSEEAEIITGRPTLTATVNIRDIGGQQPLQAQAQNIPRASRPSQQKDDRDRRERQNEAARTFDKAMATASRSYAPENLKQRMLETAQKLNDILTIRREADLHWDDATDSSFQPLPTSLSERAFRPLTALDPFYARTRENTQNEDVVRPPAFRLRRGRGGIIRLDRRDATLAAHCGAAPASSSDSSDWLFPDTMYARLPGHRRPTSIDDHDEGEELEDEAAVRTKRRKLNEVWRYNVDNGGGVGVGLGVGSNQDRVIIDDLDSKYIRHRITLLNDDDIHAFQPDLSVIDQVHRLLETPVELPPPPIFHRPNIAIPNAQIVAAQLQQQQHAMQQHSNERMEQLRQYQIVVQQQVAASQHQQQIMAAQQLQQQQQLQHQLQQQQLGAQGRTVPQQRMPSSDGINGGGSPAVNGQMLPPNGQPQNGRPPNLNRPSSQNGSMGPPPQPRPSASPTNPLHPGQLPNGHSPQIANAMALPNAKQFLQNGQPMDPQTQQRVLAARASAIANAQAQHQTTNGISLGDGSNSLNMERSAELFRQAQNSGYGDNVTAYLADPQNKARIMAFARAQAQQQQQQQHQHAQQQAQQHAQQQVQAQAQAMLLQNPHSGGGKGPGTPAVNGNGTNGIGGQQPGFPSPMMTPQMQLRLPAHAAARLSAQSAQAQHAIQRAS